MFNHFEYGAGTLAKEYERDRAAGRPIALPRNYFPGDDPAAVPVSSWRPHAELFFANWLAMLHARRSAEPVDAPMMQWLLAERRPLASVGRRFLDLLVAARSGPDALPAMLHTLASFGVTAHAVRVHRRGGEALIECRTDMLEEPAAERLAQRLAALAGVQKVAYRCSSGAGGLIRPDHGRGGPVADAQTAA
jgi:hypothetical protein